MIIGTSFDSKSYFLYINLETQEIIKVDWLNNECLEDLTRFPEQYVFQGQFDAPYIEDNISTTFDKFSTSNIEILVECDYCENRYTSTWENRRRKAVKYLGNFYERISSEKLNSEMIDLYKDNCLSCEPQKVQETTMIKHGYWHPSHTEEHKVNAMSFFKRHNLVPTSRGQRYLAKLLNAELNVKIGFFFADIVLDDKVVIEYDGGGHNLSVLTGRMTQKEFDAKEKERSEYLISKGYKLVRFISSSEYFPEESVTLSILMEAIADLYISEKQEVHIIISDKVNDSIHGKLTSIKTILENSEWGEEII